MKKLLLSVMVALAALGMNAQTKKGEGSLMGIMKGSVCRHRDVM